MTAKQFIEKLMEISEEKGVTLDNLHIRLNQENFSIEVDSFDINDRWFFINLHPKYNILEELD